MATTKLELIRAGVTLDISDEINYVHENNDGFGMAPFRRFSEQGPLQHGDTDRGFQLDARTIPLVVVILADSWTEHYTRRAALLAQLNPLEMTQVRFTLPSGAIRQLDTYCAGGPLYPSMDIFSFGMSRAAFALRANDPSWYDPAGSSVTFQLGGGGTAWEVPFAVPFTVGALTLNSTGTINYPGTWHSYPHLIRITGPIEDCVITNNTTGEKLDFTGVTIGGSDYYDIDCRYGYKTVKDSAGANKVADLTADSDLSSFHLEASAVNSINVTGTGVSAITKVEISYYTRYIGL